MNKLIQKECESTVEYMLPDYMGDVKRILSANATVIPSGKFVNDTEAEFSGIVSYDVLYADADGKITKLNATSDYDVLIPIDEDYMDSLSEPKISNLSIRLTGPRKLVAKSIVAANVRVCNNESVICGGTAFSEGREPEVARVTVKNEKMLFGVSGEREYAEEAQKVVAASREDIEILSTSGTVRISESSAVDGGVNVKGELVITSIIRTDENSVFAIKKNIPFDETITVEGANPNMQAMADAYLSSVSADVVENMDSYAVTVSAIAEYYSIISQNEEIEVISDAYLKERDSEVVYQDYSYSELLCMSNAVASFCSDFKRSDLGCENIKEIISIACDMRSLDKKIVADKIKISGEAVFTGVACEANDDFNISCYPLKMSTPFEINVNCGCQIPENSTLECNVSVVDVNCTVDSEKINVVCELKLSYRILLPHCIRRAVSCNAVGENSYSNQKSRIVVYTPDNDETLFEIAKKFHTSPAKIAKDNKLSEAALASPSSQISLKGVGKLIIR